MCLSERKDEEQRGEFEMSMVATGPSGCPDCVTDYQRSLVRNSVRLLAARRHCGVFHQIGALVLLLHGRTKLHLFSTNHTVIEK